VERRLHERHRIWIPVEILRADDSSADGVVHDVSEQGVLAVTAASFEIGARVTVRIQLPDGSPERKLDGVIARTGQNGEDPVSDARGAFFT